MEFLRNKEVRTELVCESLIILITTIGTYLWKRESTIWVLGMAILLSGVHWIYTCNRYSKIQQLSMDLNRILHEDVHISFEQYEEGELAILENEIQKMVLRLREQKEQLLKDKVYLADSIADISHQIRTPLTSINLLLSFLSEPEITEEKRQQTIRKLYELLTRIDWLITTLLKLSKLDAGTIQLKREETSMKTFIEQSVAPLLIPIELRGIQLEIETNGSFVGDVKWTSEAIGNIVKNCMEHTPESGYLKVTALENVLYREICIEDSGCGIAPEDLPYIFDRFYKGKNSSDKSFGIGLALARGIISAQNGMVKAENKEDGGAKFTIRFYK